MAPAAKAALFSLAHEQKVNQKWFQGDSVDQKCVGSSVSRLRAAVHSCARPRTDLRPCCIPSHRLFFFPSIPVRSTLTAPLGSHSFVVTSGCARGCARRTGTIDGQPTTSEARHYVAAIFADLNLLRCRRIRWLLRSFCLCYPKRFVIHFMADKLARLILRNTSLHFWPVRILRCMSFGSAIYQTDRSCRRNTIHVPACFHWHHWTRARIHKRLPSSFIRWDIPKPVRSVPNTLGRAGVLACRPLF